MFHYSWFVLGANGIGCLCIVFDLIYITLGDSATAGARFDESSNCWTPSADCSCTPLPGTLPDAATQYVRVRHQCLDVRYITIEGRSAPEFLPGGLMIGPDCVPKQHANSVCSICSRNWKDAQLVDDGPFILRTKFGPVLRRKIKLICSCSKEYRWNPSDEFIHTIKNNAEGGTYTAMFL
jgi:hypothetical protein